MGKQHPNAKHNRAVRQGKRERARRRAQMQDAGDRSPVDPRRLRIPGGERNPNSVDPVLATVGFAKRHDAAMERVRRSMDAASNPHFPCPTCGQIVRKGAKGGLWDVALRGPHWRLCGVVGVKATPEEVEEARRVSAARDAARARPEPAPGEACDDCGFAARHCRC